MEVNEKVAQIVTEHPDQVYVIQGNRKTIGWVATVITIPLLLSIATFWIKFFPTIVTENQLEKELTNFRERDAPWLQDAKLVMHRIESLEENYKEILIELRILNKHTRTRMQGENPLPES